MKISQQVENALEEIKKQYGEESIMTLGDRPKIIKDVFSSGLISLDLALGIGGYPKGRIIEIYGPESSGKTTLALQAIAEAQKKDMQCAFIDAEHAIDPDYAKILKVKVNDLILSQPDSGEHALSIVEALVRTKAVGLIVVDSVAALVPQVELDGEMSDQTIGVQARLMSKALRKLSGLLNKSKCTIIFINQIRMKIGVIFGNPETTSGGRALKFYSTIRLEIRSGAKVNQNGDFIGNDVKIKVVKNKVSPPFKTVMSTILYGKGFDKIGEIIDMASELNIIEKSGSWYSYNGAQLGQGKNSIRDYLEENTKLLKEIKAKIIKKINSLDEKTPELKKDKKENTKTKKSLFKTKEKKKN